MQMIAYLIIAAGILLLGYGYYSSRAFTEKVVKGFTGHFTSKTSQSIFIGVILIVIGILLVIFGNKSPNP
jgi:hypothetical protein